MQGYFVISLTLIILSSVICNRLNYISNMFQNYISNTR
jgi:hypothetical protein